MNIRFILSLLFTLTSFSLCAQKLDFKTLPNSIYSGPQEDMHIQGIATDQKNGYIYMSFTNKLIKLDMTGKLIASVTGFIGHLGDLDFDAETGKLYASLEFKDDAIGKGITKKLGIKEIHETGFYVAIFDINKIDKLNMNAERDDVVKCVLIKEAVKDYNAKSLIGDKQFDHRFACSGIDGIALAPSFETPKDRKKYLYIAYGVYGDTTRTDNDYQVILKYNLEELNNKAKVLSQYNFHHSGPNKPLDKYFLYTGNTTYGIQNLAYDQSNGNFLAAVYKGKKSTFPNYSLFAFNVYQIPKYKEIIVDNKKVKVKTLSLLNAGLIDEKTGIRGWKFKWGTTGLEPLGDGYYYISHQRKTPEGIQEGTIYKYQWLGLPNQAFKMVK